MNGGEVENRGGIFGSPKSPMNFFGFQANFTSKKSQINPSELASSSAFTARRDANRSKESGTRATETVKVRVETELSDAKKTVRDLALKIEQANSRARMLQDQRKPKRQESHPAAMSHKGVHSGSSDDNHHCVEVVMKELAEVKRELSKLKHEMALVLEEKKNAEKAWQASTSKTRSCSNSVEEIKSEIQELNEEQVLVELARIEAAMELEAIEAQRQEEAHHYKARVEETRSKVQEIIQEKDHAEELEMTLAVTLSDVDLLERELTMAKDMDRKVERAASMRRMEASSRKEDCSPAMLKTIEDELEAAKVELATIKTEGFKFMSSMDGIRYELKHIREENARLEEAKEKQDSSVQNLNSKILRATNKLVSLAAAEEKATAIASNLSHTLDHLRAEAEAAKKEKAIISEEITKIRGEIPKTESEIELAEERLEAAMEELKAVKLSESTALEKLKNLVESTVRARDLASQHDDTITISNFEYEYLTGRAGGAEEIADKKVAAAQAWVEALKANEKEILMKAEMVKREIREQTLAEESDNERALWKKRRNRENVLLPEITSPWKSASKTGNVTPMRKLRSSKLKSPATRYSFRSSSSTAKRREKIMPNLTKFFGNKSNIEKDD